MEVAGFPMAKAKKYIGLHRKIGQLKAQLQKQKERFAAAEQELLKAFERTGVQNVAVDGAVVFLHRQIWASTAAGRAEELADAMHAIGMGDLVKPTVHSSRLCSYVRELPRD